MKKAEQAHLDAVARLGCSLCHVIGLGHSEAEIHHLREGQGGAQRAGNYLVIPLCPTHHRHSIEGIHGQRRAFKLASEDEISLLSWTLEKILG